MLGNPDHVAELPGEAGRFPFEMVTLLLHMLEPPANRISNISISVFETFDCHPYSEPPCDVGKANRGVDA
jgi:hypothetical protein